MTREIVLWIAFIAVALALFRLWWVAVDRGHMLSAMRQARQAEMDSWNRRGQPNPQADHAYKEIVPLVRTLVGDASLQDATVFIKGGKVVGIEVQR